jgi:hypothetical protein
LSAADRKEEWRFLLLDSGPHSSFTLNQQHRTYVEKSGDIDCRSLLAVSLYHSVNIISRGVKIDE